MIPQKIKSKGLDTCRYRRMRQQQMKHTTHILSRSPAYYRFISISTTEALACPGSPGNQDFSQPPYIAAVIKIPVRLQKHQRSIPIRVQAEHGDRQHCAPRCGDSARSRELGTPRGCLLLPVWGCQQAHHQTNPLHFQHDGSHHS